MHRTLPSTRTVPFSVPLFALFVLAATGCQAGPDPKGLENENRNLHGVLAQQQQRIDDLTAERVRLHQRVRTLEAKLEKVESTEEAVEEAKAEISEQVRRILERFRGDSDIEVEQTGDGYRLVLRESVLFKTGAADLTPEGEGALGRVADALRQGSTRIAVEGHTDDVPVKRPETRKKYPRGNIELSVDRALSVWEYLVGDGNIDRERLSVAGYGPHRPRVPNSSETNRWKNRRVEILVEER